jgi:lipoprotein-releasing system permease protein
VGILASWIFDRYRLLTPPGDVYYLSHIPFDLAAKDLLLIALTTGALTLASTLYAARRAASLRPVEALRR